jgi:hypothetical protein
LPAIVTFSYWISDPFEGFTGRWGAKSRKRPRSATRSEEKPNPSDTQRHDCLRLPGILIFCIIGCLIFLNSNALYFCPFPLFLESGCRSSNFSLSLFENHRKNARPARPTRVTRPKKPDPSRPNTRRFFTFSLLLRVGKFQTRGARVGWPNGPKPARTDPCPALFWLFGL